MFVLFSSLSKFFLRKVSIESNVFYVIHRTILTQKEGTYKMCRDKIFLIEKKSARVKFFLRYEKIPFFK